MRLSSASPSRAQDQSAAADGEPPWRATRKRTLELSQRADVDQVIALGGIEARR